MKVKSTGQQCHNAPCVTLQRVLLMLNSNGTQTPATSSDNTTKEIFLKHDLFGHYTIS